MQPEPGSTVVLFLQGPASIFWSELGDGFAARGARVLKVDFGLGDRVYWRRGGSVAFRGHFRDWEAHVEGLMRREGVTDVLYCADRLPYHVVAKRVADRLGIRCHAFENGYLRPDWLTLERGGMGAWSHFPEDPGTIRAIAADVPEPDFTVLYRHDFSTLAFHEVVLGLLNHFGAPLWLFRYRADRVYDPVLEYLAWIPRFFRFRKLAAAARRIEREAPRMSFWLVTMQLQADYQIRENAPWNHLTEMLETIFSSFARHAPKEDRLVVKQHPHDNGIERWDLVCDALAKRHGLVGRVELIHGGLLSRLLDHCRGVVLANSTVGIHALQAGRPIKTLGAAVYDIPGLTHQGSLDTFWTAPEPVDPDLCSDFVLALTATIQIRGDVYDPAGRRVAIEEICARVLERRVNEPGGFVDPPPRLARWAGRLGGDGRRP